MVFSSKEIKMALDAKASKDYPQLIAMRALSGPESCVQFECQLIVDELGKIVVLVIDNYAEPLVSEGNIVLNEFSFIGGYQEFEQAVLFSEKLHGSVVEVTNAADC